MRIYLSLIVAAIILSFFTAYTALNLQKEQWADERDKNHMAALEIAFVTQTTPLYELDLNGLYPAYGHFQLIQPLIAPFARASNLTEQCSLSPEIMSREEASKSELWEAFRCRFRSDLPSGFFATPPFINDNGESFALLAFKSGRSPFSEKSWIVEHLNFFHVSELIYLPEDSLSQAYRILKTLRPYDLDQLTKGTDKILGSSFYFVKADEKTGRRYFVFSVEQLNKFFSEKEYFPKLKMGDETCFFQDGSLCWQKRSANLLEMIRPSSILIFVSSLIVLIIVILSLYSRIHFQNREEERKRHALRVLTHELRTPITNLLLLIEGLNKKSDTMEPVLLEEFLKIESEVYRLKRLADKSSTYLKSDQDQTLMSFEWVKIDSVNSFLADFLENYSGKQIIFEQLENDVSLEIDVYWFSMCLKNIVENALQHGKAPVNVTLKIKDHLLIVEVSDEGVFQKTSQSSGLGLGLKLVEKIITEMKGKIEIQKTPTVVKMSFRLKQ